MRMMLICSGQKREQKFVDVFLFLTFEKMIHTLSFDEVFVIYEHGGKIHTILACKTSGT